MKKIAALNKDEKNEWIRIHPLAASKSIGESKEQRTGIGSNAVVKWNK